MNRPLLRGSGGGSADADRLKEDISLQMQLNGNANEDSRLHGEFVGSPRALRLMMRHVNQEQPAAGSFSSPSKALHRLSDNGLINGTRNPDNLVSPDLTSLKSSLQCAEMCAAPAQAGRTNSISSGQVRNRRGFSIPLGTSMILCFMSVFVLIGMLGSGGPVRTLRLVPTLGMYRSYRRLQQEVVLDPFTGGIFGQGTVRLKELGACQGIMEEDYVPCYNASLSSGTGFKFGDKHDRHCGLQGRRKPCLTQPPEDYRVPLRWPASRDAIWGGNMKFNGEQMSQTETSAKRLVRGEDGLIALNPEESDSGMEKYSQQVATMIGVDSDVLRHQARVRTILDINCGLSRSGAFLYLKDVLTLCLAPYVANGSRVQFALERGLPAMVGSLNTRQFPFSSPSFDVIHCFECGFDWTWKNGIQILELDRILRPGGYFIWTSPLLDSTQALPSSYEQDGNNRQDLARRICWSFLSQSDQTIVWKKTMNHTCYFSRGMEARPKMCDKMHDANSTWYPLLRSCIVGSTVNEDTPASRKKTGHDYLALPGFLNEELSDDSHVWSMMVKSYWSLLTPLIFSDHPKRPGEEDPSTPSNIVRNVMDMNAVHGTFNAALLEAGKSVWVMNVVPLSGPDTLSTIYNRGLVGVLHDWCEAFPTYPRTYDLLHAIGLLSREAERSNGCGLSNLFLEMDRILRPEGWVILRDKVELIEDARIAAGQMKWESRVIEVEGVNDFQLLVCQKTFWKNFSKNPV